MTGGYSNTSN